MCGVTRNQMDVGFRKAGEDGGFDNAVMRLIRCINYCFAKIFSRCMAIAAIYIMTAYQGFGGYLIIVLFPLSMVWLKLRWSRAIVFSLFTWTFLMCVNLLLAFVTIFGG